MIFYFMNYPTWALLFTSVLGSCYNSYRDLYRYTIKPNQQYFLGTGDTALTYACENGHTDVADLLLQYNAQLEHESEGGRTPLMKVS